MYACLHDDVIKWHDSKQRKIMLICKRTDDVLLSVIFNAVTDQCDV